MVFVYYLILKPLSYLPLGALYKLSDLIHPMVSLIGYRKSIIRKNLKNSFPDKTREEINKITSNYYRHFCDIIVESIKLFSISEKEVKERCTLQEPERWQRLFDQNKNLVLVGGHFNNWEMMATAINQQVPHKIYGLYKPLKNKFMDRKINISRGKFGMILHPAKRVKELYDMDHPKPIGCIFGADQSPTTSKKVYWMNFLNQETAVSFGVENYAKKYNAPVIYGYINKIKRGYYEITYEILEENPKMSPHGKITQQHASRLEKQIKDDPANWIWSHKRWKLKRKPDETLNSDLKT